MSLTAQSNLWFCDPMILQMTKADTYSIEVTPHRDHTFKPKAKRCLK